MQPRFKKKNVTVRVEKEVYYKMKELAHYERKSISAFVEDFIAKLVLNDPTYIRYKLKEASLQQAYWELELRKADLIEQNNKESLRAYQ